MPAVRLLTGERAGQVVEAEAALAQEWVASGRAELVGPERPKTPERGRRPVETRRKPS